MMRAEARHVGAEQLPEIRALLALTCGHGQLRFHKDRAWSSATFYGARHTVAIEFSGAEAIVYGEAFIQELPRPEIALAGKLVADIQIVAIDRATCPARTMVTIELLILEDF